MKMKINLQFLVAVIFFVCLFIFSQNMVGDLLSTTVMAETSTTETKAYTGFKIKNGKTYYYKIGKKQKGLKTINGRKYYFNKVTGVMLKKAFKTVSGKRYYFASNGKACTGLKTISKNLYYFSSKGVMQKGWASINSVKYYFQSNGKAVKGTIKKIGKIYASFNADGAYQIASSYCMVNGRKMQVQYQSDPVVNDTILLAAILYAEAGGERQYKLSADYDGKQLTVYKGQLAVGYTIMNRVNSKSYPGSVKEVVYAQYQFEPARTGVLTNLLKNQSLISEECKNAAKVILRDAKTGQDSVVDYKYSSFKWFNFWALSYARNYSNFFKVYDTKEYKIIGNQVFFNYTKTITSGKNAKSA